MDSSKIKDLLLKSGIPLEVSVVKKIAKLGVEDWGEVEYERDGKIFSTDIKALKEFSIFRGLGLLVNFCIECKYKTKGHSWFFMEFPEESEGQWRSDVHNEVFDESFSPLLVKLGYEPSPLCSLNDLRFANLFNLKTAHKGVEIWENQFDHNFIREAVSQAVHGSVKVHLYFLDYILYSIAEALDFAKSDVTEFPDLPVCCITVPIVVTTAKLFRVKKNLALEDIEKENDVMKLCDEEKGILLFDTDSSIEKFSEELFEKEPESSYGSLTDKFIAVNKLPFHSFQHCHPGYVYILNYEHLEELFSSCLNLIEKLCNNFPEKYIKS